MHSVILIVDLPGYLEGETRAAKQSLLDAVPFPQSPFENTGRLAENVWLLALHSQLPLLSRMVATCQQFGFPYKYSFVNNEIEWRVEQGVKIERSATE